MSLAALRWSTDVECNVGIALAPSCFTYSFSIGTGYALRARGFAKQHRNGSETAVHVPCHALHWRQDVPSSSTEQCESKWWQSRKVSGVVDALLATALGSNNAELSDIDLLFKPDNSWIDNFGAIDHAFSSE